MILSGKKIIEEYKSGNIYISDFNESRVNPNSYNLRLDEEMLMYAGTILDMKINNPTKEVIIPKSGFRMVPGEFYLGRTKEKTFTDKYVPLLEGRSSIGRLGLSIHITAGFGDVGFDGYWTLEMTCELPLIIYPDIEICQIYYHEVTDTDMKYSNKGKYNNNDGIQASKLFLDFK